MRLAKVKNEAGLVLDMVLYLRTSYIISKEVSEMYIVSSCLCGNPCRYNGSAGQISKYPRVRELLAQGLSVAVCPELLGGLPVPRPPAEITMAQPQTYSKQGKGCECQRRRCNRELYRRRENGCFALQAGNKAILKERSLHAE